MKHVIEADHIRTNKYRVDVVGLPVSITPVSVGGIERETDSVDLPDRTSASGGREKQGEFDISVPAHHHTEIAAMNAWREEAIDPVSPTYKKAVTVTALSGTGANSLLRDLNGVWVPKDGTPDMEMDGDGEMAVIKYTLKWDSTLD